LGGAPAHAAPPAHSEGPLVFNAARYVVPAFDQVHVRARCRWCGGEFGLIYFQHWICRSRACQNRQIANAFVANHWRDGRSPFHFLPLPFQVDIQDHPSPRLLVHGAAGVSKSYFGRWYAYRRCRDIPGFKVLLLRRTYDQLEKNHIQYIPAEARAIGEEICTWKGGNVRRLTFYHGEDPDSVLFMGYCQDENDIDQHVGPEWDLILLEEGVTLLTKAISEIMARDRGSADARPFMARIGLDAQTRILSNPGGRSMNYLKDFFIDKKPDPEEYADYNPNDYACVQGEIADNPYLNPNYEAKSLGHLGRVRAAQLARGRWDVFEGQFFSDYDPESHVRAWPLP